MYLYLFFFNYKSNSGISLPISLEYIGGSGIQVGESASITGVGWYLSATGSITRSVRGMPDDMPTYGYMYASAIPSDFRNNANKYYHDSLDSQQDVFQFNFPGHSGKFFFGKNGQIIVVPYSKIKIIPTFQTVSSSNQTLKSFRIIAENGAKYDFEIIEHTTIGINTSFFPPGYSYTQSYYYGKPFGSSWCLSRIISAFNTDTIKFDYLAKSISYGYKLPQITFVNNANGSRKTPTFAPGGGTSLTHKISSIEFPDKTIVSFIYSPKYKYSDDDYALSKIKISDTAFRFGFFFDYQSSYVTGYQQTRGGGYATTDSCRLLLKAVIPFTSKQKQEGYYFDYNYPLFPILGHGDDTIQNKRDHWGYFNGAINRDTLIPKINNYPFGANRNPSYISAIANSLMRTYLPTGGYISYAYELNDHYPYTKQNNSLSITANTNSQNTISLNQVFNSQHQLILQVDKTMSRTGSVPVSGSGNLNVSIKSSDGSTQYLLKAISLYDLFYTGFATWEFNLPDNTYRLETSLSSGTSVSVSYPISIYWENKSVNTSKQADTIGGLRVFQVFRNNSDEDGAAIEKYKYVREDGKSSGFLGDIPRYDYPYREIVNYNGTSTIDYTAVTSEPVSQVEYAQSSPVGYSRVEIFKDSYAGNLGKEVQEFTDLKDINNNNYTTSFPYAPQSLRQWGLGIPKRVSLYDSAGNLVRRSVSTFQFDSIEYNNDNFKSLKLGNYLTTYYGDPYNSNTAKAKNYYGSFYWLTNGRAYLTYTTDTLYHLNGSISTNFQQLFYDTNYNVTKIVTSYDRSRGLQQEQRMYYPYNYTVGGAIGKLRDSAIITLPVSTETWITGDNNPRMVKGLITTYRQISSGDIKPDSIFSFGSNKPVIESTVGVFDATKLNRNTTYFKPQTYFSSYDVKGNLNESKSLVTGQSNSLIIDHDQQYVTAKISNAQQSDIAYTSFESLGSGNWTIGSTARNITDKLTGKRSYNLSSGNVSKSGLSSSTQYYLSVWAKSGGSVSVNSNTLNTPVSTQQGWNFYAITLSNISSVTISGTATIDEIRLHPKDANMMTSTYEPLIGLTSTTDANNTIVYNEFDNLNRPYLIRDKDRNIVKRMQYEDSAMLFSEKAVWQFQSIACRSSNPGLKDSIFIDTNPYSDSVGFIQQRPLPGLDCNCPGTNQPQFKVVYGQCEIGTWAVTSSVYKKINNVWVWECTHRYCFSDGSESTYFELSTHSTSCSITCFVEW